MTAIEAELKDAGGDVVWALLGNRVGDNRTIAAVAQASGLPTTTLALRFNAAGGLPNLRRAGSLFSLTARSRALIRGPWPDVVITSGKRAVPVALWIRAASRGRTRLIHLGRPQAPLSWFDLVVTTAQYGLPPRPNVLVQRFPPSLPAAPAPIRDDLAALPRPRLAVIVGGDAPPLKLDAATARALAAEAMARARASGGSLLVATSPRTSRAAVDALKDALKDTGRPVRLSVYGERPNDYGAFVAAADAFLVTAESASMATEAAMTGAPIALFPLPARLTPTHGAARTLRHAAETWPALAKLREALLGWGLARSSSGIGPFTRGLEADGFLAGGPAAQEHATAELAEAGRRVRTLSADARFLPATRKAADHSVFVAGTS